MKEVVVTVVESRANLWEVLAGRAPGKPTGPADPGLWHAVRDRLNPAKAAPCLREGVEAVELTSARGSAYVMLRSADPRRPCYVRLAPEEWALAQRMDGQRSAARLVAEFARITGRLAPEQVTRIIADLAANRMLEELPLDAFRPLEQVRRRPLAARFVHAAIAFARGRRVVLAGIDPFVRFLYAIGGRLLFTRVVAVLAGLVAVAGMIAFGVLWVRGEQSVFLSGDSYVTGLLVLLGFNVFALACHELGHALAVRHAGRRVPAAGFLIYFGIPSVFVDTTDVWMAGRRARIVTTAAGPASGLVLAGVASLVGLTVPAAAPWAFKLAFVWYLNALFNLNPFLALDGYYLLMDWLEVPNLRARAMAWVGARLRRRPPAFAELDREGRLIALYGMLAVAWMLIAANLAWRVYADRVAGAVTGLWHSGWLARLLLFVVVAVVAAPLLYIAAGWLAGVRRRRRQRRVDRHTQADQPRRLDALRASALGGFGPKTLTALAREARWVWPRDGEPLVDRGVTLQGLYVVVEGVAEARRPGDPGGVIRQRVGPGGVIGLANVLTGNPVSLSWYTVGAALLTVPASAVVEAVGDLPAPPPADLAELEDLLDETPQFATLSAEAYLGVTARAQAVHLRPGAPLVLSGSSDAALVAAGVLERYDGRELRRGAVVGPYGNDEPAEPAKARTAARVWWLPALASLAPLPGTRVALTGGEAVYHAPAAGAHPAGGYPPLAIPPGPPPADIDPETDQRFERRLWWLLMLLLVFGLTLGVANLWPGPAWAEMPTERVLFTVSSGTAGVTVDGVPARLTAGDDRYLAAGDEVRIPARSSARLVFRGGAVAVLCSGTAVRLGDVTSRPGGPTEPVAGFEITGGRALVDTASTSAGFRSLALVVTTGAGPVRATGPARLTVEPAGAQVAGGAVTLGDERLDANGRTPTCGDGTALPARAGAPQSEEPSPIPVTPSASESASASASASTAASASRAARSPAASSAPAGQPPPPPPPPPSSPSSPPPPLQRPNVTVNPHDPICSGQGVVLSGTVSDPDDPPANLTATFTWSMPNAQRSDSGPLTINPDGSFSQDLGKFAFGGGADTINITVTVRDNDNQSRTGSTSVDYNRASCGT